MNRSSAKASYAYLGPEGTYSHEAALAFIAQSGNEGELIECSTIAETFDMVDRGRATYGVVPIENALEGSVNDTLDAFAFTSEAHILAELVLDIHHNLIAVPGTKPEDITQVISHPQALGQCRRWILQHLPGRSTDAATSTAEAVRRAMAIPGAAGIGTRLAAQLFGGIVLEEQIEDRFGNQTRFVLIGHDTVPRSAKSKTSLALFMKEDRPGTLLMILAEFAYAGVNLTKIQSRPTKRALGDYMFLIDIEGHAEDPLTKTALDSLRLKMREVKLLGSYGVQGSVDEGKN